MVFAFVRAPFFLPPLLLALSIVMDSPQFHCLACFSRVSHPSGCSILEVKKIEPIGFFFLTIHRMGAPVEQCLGDCGIRPSRFFIRDIA
jgi:hypothetical protein